MSFTLTQKQIDDLNSGADMVKEIFIESLKAVKAACLFEGQIQKNKTVFIGITQAFQSSILLTIANGEYTFEKVKAKFTSNNEYTIENLEFEKIHAISFDGKGITVLDKNNKILKREDLTKEEKVYATFFSIMIIGFFEFKDNKEVAEEAIGLFDTESSDNDIEDIENILLDELQKLKQKMGIGEPEGLKDVNEFPIEIQRKFCDVADGKINENIEQILTEYIGVMITLLKTANEVSKETAIGWSNLFILKNDDGIIIAGDFKSRFNTFVVKNDGSKEFGLFNFDGVMSLAPTVKYNGVKAAILNIVYDIASDYVKTGKKLNADMLALTMKMIMSGKNYEPDRKSVEPLYKFKIRKIEFTNAPKKEMSFENAKHNLDKKLKPENQEENVNFLNAQKDIVDYCDGKKIKNPMQTIKDYYYAVRLIMLHVACEQLKIERPIGWNNLFYIKSDDGFGIIGEFNSSFNVIQFNKNGDISLGVFDQPNVNDVESKPNKAKAIAFIGCMNLAEREEVTEEEFEIIKQGIDNAISDFKPDRINIKPKFNFKVNKLDKEEDLKMIASSLSELDQLTKQMQDLISGAEKEKPTPENMSQEEKAFDLMLNCSNPQELISNAYLIEAIVEVMKDSTRDKTMMYMETAVFSNDKDTHVMRFIFNKKENIIFTYDLKKDEFYIQEKETLNIWKMEDFEDDRVEYKKIGIIKMLLLTIAGKVPFDRFFTGLIAIASVKK